MTEVLLAWIFVRSRHRFLSLQTQTFRRTQIHPSVYATDQELFHVF